MTKNFLIGAITTLGIIFSTSFVYAQEKTQYHPRYKGEVKMQEKKSYVAQRQTLDYKNFTPESIATNKTGALNQKVGLTNKQERKVYMLYKKEAKQEIKLNTIRKENRHAMKSILTKEQYTKAFDGNKGKPAVYYKAPKHAVMLKKDITPKRHIKSCDKSCCK